MYAFFYQCISLQSINAGFVVCRLRNVERKRNLGEKERKRLRAELAVNISYFLLFNSLLNFPLLFSLLLLREFFIGVCSAWAQLFFVPFFVRVFVFICFLLPITYLLTFCACFTPGQSVARCCLVFCFSFFFSRSFFLSFFQQFPIFVIVFIPLNTYANNTIPRCLIDA